MYALFIFNMQYTEVFCTNTFKCVLKELNSDACNF